MKEHWSRWLWLFVLAGFCSCNPTADDNARVRDIVTAFHSAFDQKNVQAICALSAPDMQWYTLNGKAVPCADLAQFFQPLFDRWLNVRTELIDVTVTISGKIAVARYKSRMTLTYAKGETVIHNLHTMVVVQQQNTWKVWHHHMSTE
jgi:ketosteroid isomerase-like protein